MDTFTLHLHSALRSETLEGVASFVGEDASGSFGLQARHERFMTVLVFGLARYRPRGQPWQYLALPGGVLRFADNRLTIAARHYLRGTDYAGISAELTGQMLREEQALAGLKRNLERLETALLRQLLELNRGS
ncbi:F-type H+-transporting ATPase subunit epsilon [Methylomagnum ishizawai]|uniref:F-type H+-transporting ATPase subunit epsilon n=1 Tax=Methylomagnum ishizawai TaxID=1760988 RepID=A0A1Y6CZR5_9GAMM|nr:F0F1 ATP synthase subunit epsilon [Methylomagnum ishizawai]SMF95877.1 F-type H+-transporting ATPase subunit epsilon [Methylomagnum ishizawai]